VVRAIRTGAGFENGEIGFAFVQAGFIQEMGDVSRVYETLGDSVAKGWRSSYAIAAYTPEQATERMHSKHSSYI
jgi:hypothetical protein